MKNRQYRALLTENGMSEEEKTEGLMQVIQEEINQKFFDLRQRDKKPAGKIIKQLEYELEVRFQRVEEAIRKKYSPKLVIQKSRDTETFWSIQIIFQKIGLFERLVRSESMGRVSLHESDIPIGGFGSNRFTSRSTAAGQIDPDLIVRGRERLGFFEETIDITWGEEEA